MLKNCEEANNIEKSTIDDFTTPARAAPQNFENKKNVKVVYAYTMYCSKNAVCNIEDIYRYFFSGAPLYKKICGSIDDEGSLWLMCSENPEIPNKIMETYPNEWKLRGDIEPIVINSIQYDTRYQVGINTIIWSSNEKYSLIRLFED